MRKPILLTLTAIIAVGLIGGLAMSKSSKGAGETWLGVYSQSVDSEMSEAFDLPVKYGVIVNEVVEESPAEKAGLKEGDIIVRFDRSKIADQDDLVEMIQKGRPGDKVTLIIMRDGKELKLPIVLEKKPAAEKQVWVYKGPKSKSKSFTFVYGDERSHIGVSLMDLTQQLGDFFGIAKGKGSLITEVQEDSPAKEAGLKAGDVIVAINGDEVYDPEDVVDAVEDKEPGEKVEVKIVRDKKEMTIPVEVAEDEDDSYKYSFKQFHAPDIDITLPKMKGLYRSFPSDQLFDYKDLEEQMEQFKKELKSLQKELKELRKQLE